MAEMLPAFILSDRADTAESVSGGILITYLVITNIISSHWPTWQHPMEK